MISQEHAEQYRQIVSKVIASRDDGFCYELDGGDIQDMLVAGGILEEFEAAESCGENCVCAEEGFPVLCYRLTEAGEAAEREEK